jgi:hypothetical protein
VSWYAPQDGWGGEFPYEGKYKAERPPCRISALETLPWDSGWQWPITFKTDMRPKLLCHEAMRKWAQVFADEEDEAPLVASHAPN